LQNHGGDSRIQSVKEDGTIGNLELSEIKNIDKAIAELRKRVKDLEDAN
jgi:hypothetical protein